MGKRRRHLIGVRWGVTANEKWGKKNTQRVYIKKNRKGGGGNISKNSNQGKIAAHKKRADRHVTVF